jgi:NAD(P)-dependent dehydrogenase (short-subunit alcohol dehydrogenase family)
LDIGLDGKVAIVTGASRGIGLAVTRALAGEGVHVIAGARGKPDRLADLVESGQVDQIEVDLATPGGPAELVAAATEHGRLDILVNNVGTVTPRLDGFLAVTDEQWLASITLNLMAAVRTTRAALPMMLSARRGTIVTISSVNAFLPDPAVIDYCAAKAALTNFSKALSKEVGPKGIRVNTVSPGPVATDLWLGADGVAETIARVTGEDPRAIARETAAGTVTGRFSQPAEVADLVLLLASERAGNTAGADFVIDGGLVATV